MMLDTMLIVAVALVAQQQAPVMIGSEVRE
jgi:hypothetical protein